MKSLPSLVAVLAIAVMLASCGHEQYSDPHTDGDGDAVSADLAPVYDPEIQPMEYEADASPQEFLEPKEDEEWSSAALSDERLRERL